MKALALILLVACTADLPAQPSYQQDVAPILAANCGRCHGGSPIGGAPDSFRITYPTAKGQAMLITTRVTSGEMPPRWPLDDDQIEIIVRWTEQKDELGFIARGAPRPGNRAPVLTVLAIVDGTIEYTLYDPDGDLVEGSVDVDGMPTSLELHQGRSVVTIDRSVALPGMRAVLVRLDDGGAETSVDLGVVAVP